MMDNRGWNELARRIFPKRPLQAPAFLWTRVLAGIEAEEARRAGAWWMQWRWMSRVTLTVALMVSLGSFYLLEQTTLPLEYALEGRSDQERAIQLASTDMTSLDDSAVLLVGADS